jgi:predicted dehydrogenase
MHGERGMLRFNLEDFNHLQFLDATEPAAVQGPRLLRVTGPGQPYSGNFWKPGHVIGYEHTFIAALGDFLAAVAGGGPYHPDFEDGLRVQAVLDAAAKSARQRQWVAVD